MPVTPALRKFGRGDYDFEVNLCYSEGQLMSSRALEACELMPGLMSCPHSQCFFLTDSAMSPAEMTLCDMRNLQCAGPGASESHAEHCCVTLFPGTGE